MKIIKVHVEMLYTTKQFENERIGFSAELDAGESPETAIALLKDRAFRNSQAYQRLLEEAEKIQTGARKVRKAVDKKLAWADAVKNGDTTLPFDQWWELEKIQALPETTPETNRLDELTANWPTPAQDAHSTRPIRDIILDEDFTF
jgi:hypothetical protein